MRWKKCLRLSLPAFLCLVSLQWTFAAVTSTTESTKVEETTKAGISVDQQWKYPRPCFVEKSKVDELIVQMNSTVRILNRGDGNLQCQEKLEVKIVDAEDIEICSEERIQRIQKDLFKVAGSLFQHAIRLTEPSEEEIDLLDLIKFQLFEDLQALRVFYGPLTCDSYSIALFPFQRLITPVKESLDQVYSLFKTSRPTRLPPPTPPATTPKPTIDEMLNPEKSFAELIEMTKSNPSAMSRALPKIVSQRYSRRVSTFDSLLDFVNALPTTENKIIGFSAVYNEMHGHNQNPEALQLQKLAKNVRLVNASAPATPATLNGVARSKLDELAQDPDLLPLMVIGEKADCHVTNVAYGTQLTADGNAWPYSAYVYQDQTKATLQIYPAIQNYKLVFRILQNDKPFFASDTNTNTDSTYPQYQTKTSERYVLRIYRSDLPTNAEINWKLVPVPNNANQFKILSAKYDDFMFAHKSETGYGGYRRVLLGKKDYSAHDHIPNADIWTLDCK